GLSGLLTTTMLGMEDVIEELKRQGLRDQVKVIIGGAPVSKKYAEQIGADGYGNDAAQAIKLVRSLL
ncbi:MAG: cobalamin-binding protein, partial [Anaerolineaceae bacterium]|nr:cobalamin-binding protein [Anaerolineaceae bacterium]